MVSVAQETPEIGQCGRVCHVYRDGMAVTEWHFRYELVQWRPSVSLSAKFPEIQGSLTYARKQ